MREKGFSRNFGGIDGFVALGCIRGRYLLVVCCDDNLSFCSLGQSYRHGFRSTCFVDLIGNETMKDGCHQEGSFQYFSLLCLNSYSFQDGDGIRGNCS